MQCQHTFKKGYAFINIHNLRWRMNGQPEFQTNLVNVKKCIHCGHSYY